MAAILVERSCLRDPAPVCSFGKEGNATMQRNVQHLNPEGLHTNPAFSHASGTIVGKGDIAAQTVQVLQNLEIGLAAGGAKLEHVIKWNVYIVPGQSAVPGFEVFRRASGDRGNPPTITVLFVAGLANPDSLVEIDAIAVVPQD